MIEDNDFVVVARLTTGEELISVLSDEDENYVEFKYPMVVTDTVVNGEESSILIPWNSYTDDEYYRIQKSNVLFVKKIHPIFVQKYINVVNYFNEIKEVKLNSSGFYGEPNDSQELEDNVDRLEAILDGKYYDEVEEISPKSFFIEGPDTVQ